MISERIKPSSLALQGEFLTTGPPGESLFLIFWLTVDLQCYISFCCTAKWFSYIIFYICVPFSSVQFFVTLGTVACQAPLSMGFSRQEYWSGVPLPSPVGESRAPHCGTSWTTWCVKGIATPPPPPPPRKGCVHTISNRNIPAFILPVIVGHWRGTFRDIEEAHFGSAKILGLQESIWQCFQCSWALGILPEDAKSSEACGITKWVSDNKLPRLRLIVAL